MPTGGLAPSPRSARSLCPLWRRLLAISYDSVVLSGVIFVLWQPVPLLPDGNWPDWLGRGIRLGYLLSICLVFFGWFWTHGGQTLGMRAWNIRLVRLDGQGAVTWRQAGLRFGVSLLSWLALGAGFLWSLGRTGLAWQDTFSATCLVRVTAGPPSPA